MNFLNDQNSIEAQAKAHSKNAEKHISSFHYLDYVLSRDGFVIFIDGKKEDGKTDFSLLIAEYCQAKKFREHIATNIRTESYLVEAQIVTFPDLEAWLQKSGRKLFILDEAGKHIQRYRFMTAKNVEIMNIIQLIRHYDAGFIGIAPSKVFIDSNFLNTDILDMRIRKVSKTQALINDSLQHETYFLTDIPPTRIKFDSKDIAKFTFDKPLSKESPLCCQVADLYAKFGKYSVIQKQLNLQPEQIRIALRKHLAHSLKTQSSVT